MSLKDREGRRLESGAYVFQGAPDGGYDMIKVEVAPDGNSFTAQRFDGYLPITNFKDAAKNFSRLSEPATQTRFILDNL